MLERLKPYRDRMVEIWNKTNIKQRIAAMTAIIFILVSLSIFIVVATKKDFVQLYGNLSEREAGEISAKLGQLGVEYKLTPDGKGIFVPSDKAAQLKVDLAAEGIPKTGTITYESFAQNMNFGLTDKQFSVVERDAMQNELRRMMIQGIRGVQNAQVMITLPQETIWVNQAQQEATASIILDIEAGYSVTQDQVNALYTIVSKSIPNLPLENIIITNQYGEELVPNFESSNSVIAGDFGKMQQITREAEKNIQRELQRLLGTIMQDKDYVVQVFATMDFTQETRMENLVTAPNSEDNEGLIISSERINENYVSHGGDPQGIVGTGVTDVPGYQANDSNGMSTYEKNSDRINYEVNRITKTIVENQYRIKDLSINVAYDETANVTKEDVENIVKNIVRNVLATYDPNPADSKVNDRVTVTPFKKQGGGSGSVVVAMKDNFLLYVIGGIAVLAVLVIMFMLMRQRRRNIEEEEYFISKEDQVPPLEEAEESAVRKQLGRLAKERPQDFVSLLRSWITED